MAYSWTGSMASFARISIYRPVFQVPQDECGGCLAPVEALFWGGIM